MEFYEVWWKWYKAKRYYEVRAALVDLKFNILQLLGIRRMTEKEVHETYKYKTDLLFLYSLIDCLLNNRNPYDIKIKCMDSESIMGWLKYYRIEINLINKEYVDILFMIMKKIANRVPIPKD